MSDEAAIGLRPVALPSVAIRSAAPRLQSLEMLRGVAALLVVLFHTQSIFGRRTTLDVFGGAFANGNRGVDLFFVLSGFVITYVHRCDWDQPARLGSYAFNRVTRIYPAACIMTAVAIATFLLGSALGVEFGLHSAEQEAGRLDAWNILASLLLLPQQGIPIVNVTWTLKYEMVFYLVFSLLLIDRRFLAAFILWQGAVLACLLGGVDFGESWLRYFLGPMCLEFAIGMGCAVLVMQRAALPGSARRAVPAAMLALGLALFLGAAVFETYWLPVTPVPDVMLYGGGAGLIVTALALLELSGRLRPAEFLVSLGGSSYAIYLVHFSVITLVSGVLVRRHLIPVNTAVILAVALFGVLAGIGFDRLVDRPIQRALRRLRPKRREL